MNQVLFTKGSDLSQWLHVNSSDLDRLDWQSPSQAINNSHDSNKQYVYYRSEGQWTSSPYIFDRNCNYTSLISANYMIYQEHGEVGYGGLNKSWPNANTDFNPQNFNYDVFVRSSTTIQSLVPSITPIIPPVNILIDRVTRNTGMTGWIQIKHLPSTTEIVRKTWFSGNTFNGSTVNSYTVGNPNNNAAEWSIPFDSANVEYYLFYENTNDFNSDWYDRWAVMRKSDMVPVDYPNWKPFYKALNYPNGKTQGLQYNRTPGHDYDPNLYPEHLKKMEPFQLMDLINLHIQYILKTQQQNGMEHHQQKLMYL